VTELIIDASIALCWCFEDEATVETDALLDQVALSGAHAPGLWRLEVANVLLMAERRGRLTTADVETRLSRLDRLPVQIDHEASGAALAKIVQFARSERLTAYDAAYLELALRRGATLATKDADLAQAARRLGLTVAP
jgi:predicted nucleic acid-binding protein